jgi:hypothetical protein
MFIIEAIASVLIFLASVTGLASEASQPVSQPVSVTCEEDMACWDSETMGNMQAPMSANEADAWEAFNDLGLVPSMPNMSVSYIETLDYLPTSFPTGYFAVGSDSQPQLIHIMKWDMLYYA